MLDNNLREASWSENDWEFGALLKKAGYLAAMLPVVWPWAAPG